MGQEAKETIIKHFTASVFVVSDSKVLLLEHKKIASWLPPGGHVEENELPNETAVREVKEETGLDVELIVTDDFIREKQCITKIDNRATLVPCPWRVLFEEVSGDHYHIDFLYLAKISDRMVESMQGENEDNILHWFTIYELEQATKIFQNVKYYAMKAIQEFSIIK
jgi:8-oxo-dGTP pyrophosphatase MutT (NUDIX family)